MNVEQYLCTNYQLLFFAVHRRMTAYCYPFKLFNAREHCVLRVFNSKKVGSIREHPKSAVIQTISPNCILHMN